MASEVHLSSGLPETIIDPEPAPLVAALAAATDRATVAKLASGNPSSLAAWARLGSFGRDEIEQYAAFRVGYHRGLDRLRQSGWRGSGYVRWIEESNRPFLRCLAGLQASAEAIGESDEAERCLQFLEQLDPSWHRTEHD